ncbi:iron chelate uptake ABC transporter family permease subunit [Allocatelliglobosispora scoriae]|uniref:iron chelate uptake ABC transporter family permease subunit n=1 Tax=Allocatelliglobosispora scoriae TaxID=643052 RepID=UPI001C867E0E
MRALGLLVGLGLLVLIALLSIWVGARELGFTSVWRVLWHPDSSIDSTIIRELRVPRTLLGLEAGVALGLAGALMQGLTRNPLADPGLLGVELGASAAIVVAIAYLGVVTAAGYVWFALAGAAAVSVLVYLLGTAGRGRASPERLVLAGTAIGAALGSLVYAITLLHPAAFNAYRFWVVGSLNGRPMEVVVQLAPFVVVGVLVALSLAQPLNAMALGDEAGRALGVHIGRTRALGALAVTLLCGAATAGAGPITFIGLIVPHGVRMLVGPDQRWVLPYSMVLAPILLLGADIAGRVVARPAELEVGIVVVAIGAPIFILLARRRRLAQL